MGHRFRDILVAMANGKKIESRHITRGPRFYPLQSTMHPEPFRGSDIDSLINGFDANWEFRVAPEKITIGDKTIEKPHENVNHNRTNYAIVSGEVIEVEPCHPVVINRMKRDGALFYMDRPSAQEALDLYRSSGLIPRK